MDLLPHQRAAIAAVLRARDFDGYKRQVVHMATGAGKTFFAGALAKVLLLERGSGRTLYVAHREEILDHALAEFAHFFPRETLGIVQADRNDFAAQHIFATIQTIEQDHRLNLLLSSGKFGTIFYDECHRAVAPTWKKVAKAALANDGLLIGLTATPMRTDNQSLRQVFDECTYSIGILDLIASDPPRLCDLRRVSIRVPDLNLKGVLRGENGDFEERALGQAIAKSKLRQKLAIDAIWKHCQDWPGVYFAVNIADARSFTDLANASGIPTEVITGKTPRQERKEIWARWESGETRVVANFNVLTEGIDAPWIRFIIMGRHTTSQGLYIQAVGRGVRPLASDRTKPYSEWVKKDCLVIDLADNEHSVLVLPELLGTTEERMGTRSVREMIEQKTLIVSEPAIPTYTPGAQELRVAANSLFTTRQWKPVGRDNRTWSCAGETGTVYVERDLAGFTATWVSKDGKTRRHIQRAPTNIEHAFGQGELYIARLEGQVKQRQRARDDDGFRAQPASPDQITRVLRVKHHNIKPATLAAKAQSTTMTQGEVRDFWDEVELARKRHVSWHELHYEKRKKSNPNERTFE
jgi:superfamily II DNA or RNA helicase